LTKLTIKLLYDKLDGVMRSALMRMNVNVDEGITVARLGKVGIQFMNSYTVERESSMKVAGSKAKVNTTSGDACHHGGTDELAQLAVSIKKIQQSHEQMLQQQQQQFQAQIAALVPHARQQGQQSATSNNHTIYQAPSSQQYDNRDHRPPAFVIQAEVGNQQSSRIPFKWHACRQTTSVPVKVFGSGSSSIGTLALVDTGSDICAMSLTMAKSAALTGVNVQPLGTGDYKTVAGVEQGDGARSVGTMELLLTMNDVVLPVRVYVAEALPVALILGGDFQRAHNASLTWRKGLYYYKPCPKAKAIVTSSSG
jgi:hypothetical protein